MEDIHIHRICQNFFYLFYFLNKNAYGRINNDGDDFGFYGYLESILVDASNTSLKKEQI